jgi:hypothetical protein
MSSLSPADSPALSVILPVYNGLAYLEPAVRSVLDQSFGDFELIVIDDGSSDGSGQWLRSLKDPRLRCFTQENRGLAATLNRAIELSSGSYIARMDQDDICLPGRFRKQLDFLEANPAVGLLGTAAKILEGDRPTDRMLRHPCDDAALRVGLLFDNYFMHSSVMLRRSALLAAGSYCEDRARQPPEDYELWSRLMRHCRIANLPDVLMVYREVAGSMSRSGVSPFLANVERISAENIAWASGAPADAPEVLALSALYHGDYARVPDCFDAAAMQALLLRAITAAAAGDVTAAAEPASFLSRKIALRRLDHRLGGVPGKLLSGPLGGRARALLRQLAGR